MNNITFRPLEILLGGILFIISVYVGYVVSGGSVARDKVSEELGVPENIIRDPIITSFDAAASPDFPKEIPIEDGVKITQSYNQNHFKYLSSTVGWDSLKTTNENYTLYAEFLSKNGWTIANKATTKTLSNLYAKKDSYELSIVIVPNVLGTVKSHVTITHLTNK